MDRINCHKLMQSPLEGIEFKTNHGWKHLIKMLMPVITWFRSQMVARPLDKLPAFYLLNVNVKGHMKLHRPHISSTASDGNPIEILSQVTEGGPCKVPARLLKSCTPYSYIDFAWLYLQVFFVEKYTPESEICKYYVNMLNNFKW